HRWVDYYRPFPNDREERPVGDWVIAPRLLIERGEYVKKNNLSLVPVKHLNSFKHELDSRPASKAGDRNKFSLPVHFGDDSILVDFEGGSISYTKTEVVGETTTTKRVEDRAATELLILKPDGRMIAHKNLADEADAKRKERYEAVLKRNDELKAGGAA